MNAGVGGAQSPAMAPDEAACDQAIELHRDGRLADAEELCQSILAAHPESRRAALQLGVLRMQQGRLPEAEALTRRAIALGADDAEAYSNLGTALNLLGQPHEAIGEFEASLTRDAERPEAHFGLGTALHALQRRDEAVACYRRALAIDPDYAEAWCALGGALLAGAQAGEALGCFRRAIEIDPEYVEAICGLAESHAALQHPDEAITGLQRALALRPGHAPAHRALGRLLKSVGRHADAVASFHQALAVAPEDGDAQADLGGTLEELGRMAEARSAFERAVASNPQNLRYLYALVTSGRMRADDPGMRSLEDIERRQDALADPDRIIMHFALGKALADLGHHESSFRHLLAGNALKRRTLVHDERATFAMFDRIRSVFTADLIGRYAGAGHASRQPVFIVGMPRSGSTLIEQVIASHPQAIGAGERAEFNAAMRECGFDTPAQPFPESLLRIDARRFERLGAEYLTRLRAALQRAGGEGGNALAPEAAACITDKMPANFAVVGLIHLALPGARFIFTRRDPVDTCLSCFSKLFTDAQTFAYDLGELGRYHRACSTLLDHWRAVLPPGAMLDVHYEALVADFEAQARRLIAHCGLQWHPACLSFHETERVVRTASATQVREPVYRNSLNRWRPGPELLLPLLEGLGETRLD